MEPRGVGGSGGAGRASEEQGTLSAHPAGQHTGVPSTRTEVTAKMRGGEDDVWLT